MQPHIARKWRPPLALVLGGALAVVLVLPLAGLLALREMQAALGFRVAALLVAGVVGLVTAALGYLLWRLLFAPVTALAVHAQAVRQGAEPPPVTRYGTRELEALGRSVLAMARTLQDREASIRSFADHVTHEMKTPLTAIKGAAELLTDGPLGADERRLVGSIAAAGARMQEELAQLAQITAARAPLHHGVVTLAAAVTPVAGLDICLTGAEVLLPLAPAGMAVVLGHLLHNAAEQGAGRVEIAARQTAGGVVLTLCDDGPGISEGNRDRVFQPFFTTRRTQGGTGMGLAIVRALLGAHGAEIALKPGPGACFVIHFAES